ncbi:DUF1799 domain-containing protein [Chromohalobacter japonicus]|uniref:DUF1799 domain-containing protein n=1 Tax=Chromohalobacter japonicus TaxID=223900 RepID=UPI0009F8602C
MIGITIKERYAHANDTELWAEHREAFETFCACATQWHVIAGMDGAVHQGIDYTAQNLSWDARHRGPCELL